MRETVVMAGPAAEKKIRLAMQITQFSQHNADQLV